MRAGLLSPPPLAATLLASPARAEIALAEEGTAEPDQEKAAKDVDDAEREQEGPTEPAMGRGGWLVNLVDYLQQQPPTETTAAGDA